MRVRSHLQPADARVLLVTGEASSERAAAWSDVVAGFVEPVQLDVTPDLLAASPAGYAAVVVEGPRSPLRASDVELLRQMVERGGRLLAIAGTRAEDHDASWWELLGARPIGTEPHGEWYFKTACSASVLTRRLPEEFPVTGSLVRLDLSGESVPVLQVSVGFHDHAVLSEQQVGDGRVVVAGVGGGAGAAVDPNIAQLFRRALMRPAGAMPERPIRLGILGYGPYGGMGLHHGLAAQATDGVELVAVCDSDPGRLKAAEESFDGLRTSVSFDDLAADEDVDAVVIATPPVTHCDLALAMLRAGKHVVLEKPMCLTLDESDELLGVAEEQGLMLTVHQSRRFDADFVTVRRLVAGGALGEVFNVETFVGGFEHPCRAWHSEVSVSGGAIYDWGSHHLDWILQLMDGFPVALSAHGHKRVWRDVTNLDQVRVRLAWEDGREAEFLQSDVAGVRRPKFFVQGTKATLAGWYRPLLFERLEPGVGYIGEHTHHAEAPVELLVARYEPGTGLTETRVPHAPVRRYEFHRNLADHLEFGEPLAVTPESVRKVVVLLEAAQRSTDGGNVTVSLPRL
jgi:predicted dehydrogenase